MGQSARGKRDGTGPFKGSYRKTAGSKIGRRKAAGQKCPKAKRK